MSQQIIWPSSSAMFKRNVILSSEVISRESVWMIRKSFFPNETREEFDRSWSYGEAKEHGKKLGVPFVQEDLQ